MADNVLDATRAIAKLSDRIDAPAWIELKAFVAEPADLIPLHNGLLKYRTRTLHDPSMHLFNYAALPFDYLPDPPPPVEWLRFLASTWVTTPSRSAACNKSWGTCSRVTWHSTRCSRPAAMSAPERAKLSKMLVAGALANGFPTELWTLARYGKLIKWEFGHSFSSVHVWRVIRAIGFPSQRPTGRAIQRDEAAIRSWKTKRWPALKKRQTPAKNHRLHRRIGTE